LFFTPTAAPAAFTARNGIGLMKCLLRGLIYVGLIQRTDWVDYVSAVNNGIVCLLSVFRNEQVTLLVRIEGLNDLLVLQQKENDLLLSNGFRKPGQILASFSNPFLQALITARGRKGLGS
jgi:hypothetical protein